MNYYACMLPASQPGDPQFSDFAVVINDKSCGFIAIDHLVCSIIKYHHKDCIISFLVVVVVVMVKTFSTGPVDEAFPYHTVTPNVSGSQYDVYNYKKPSYPSWSVVLRRTHGKTRSQIH